MFIVYINVDPSLIMMSSHSPASVLFVHTEIPTEVRCGDCMQWQLCYKINSVIVTFYRQIMVVFNILIGLHNRVA